MKLKLSSLFLLFAVLLYTSCKKDDPATTYDQPTVTAPSGVQNVENGATGQSLTFTVSVDAALTATYTATGSGVTVTNGSGSVSGSSVTVNYDAGTTAGAAAITLKVTDSEGQSDQATAVINIAEDPNEILLTSNITADATWTADKTYILGGRITVVDGVTLTIEPGTVIKGQAGAAANATALLIARGGTIMAEGTAELPIIFTSVADEITGEDIAAGNYASPNLDPVINGLWGGVIILGKAPISASNDNDEDVSEVQIEGIPTSDTNGLYGGDDPADNSGVFKYVSIRHGGTNIGSGNEINGLSLGGVGSGTVIDNVEIVSNQDDAIEFFGGTVNVTNLISWNVGDDGVDTDQAWAGTLDNFVVIAPAGHCFELDGPEGTAHGSHTIKNGLVIASTADRPSEDLINTDANTEVTLENIFITGINDGQMINRITAPLVFYTNIMLDVPADELGSHVNGTPIPAGIVAGGAPTADLTGFSWTWAVESGTLDGF
ncbi:MAG: hypothetical protein R2824_28555 [Saprospiraceae bacterium]|nr:hypothetical protein [Lewinella sp.]